MYMIICTTMSGLVLHEENIRLLTESHKSLKEMATAEQLKCARSNLTGESHNKTCYPKYIYMCDFLF